MKKLIITVVAVTMLLSLFALAGCNKDGDTRGTTTTTQSSDAQQISGGVKLYEYSEYGYHIYYPEGFDVLNEEGNMVEFMNESGVDFTVLVLDNRYDNITKMINGELEEGDEVVKQGDNYFMVHSSVNGRTNYTYYYYGEDMVRCELSYLDERSEEMKGLENTIMVEEHSHPH